MGLFSGIRKVVEGAVDAVTTVAGAVVEVLESILGWFFSALAFVVDLVFAIPILGRLIRWIWNLALTVVWGLVGLLDFLLALIGILPEKKLRVCTVILKDPSGNAVATPASVVPNLQNAIDIFKEEANVRLVPSKPFQFESGFAGKPTAGTDWIKTVSGPSDTDVLDVDCGAGAAGEDLWLTGTRFEWLAATSCFYGNFRRLIGYGAPVVVFVVRSVDGSGRLGCSLGPLSGYVTIQGSNSICVAHELGHACNLWHVSGAGNLMNPRCGQRNLGRFQVAVLRNSRHVTYF